jgi:hypothetical protein
MKKSYCTQNNGDCSTCSLSSYNKDCQNNPIVARDEYIHARIPADLKAQAQAYAAETGRTLTGLVEWLLRKEMNYADSLKRGGQIGGKVMKKAISEIKWVAAIHGDDKFENGVIRIGIQRFEDDYSDKIFYDLVAENGDDISTGGEKTYEKAVEAIDMMYRQWVTLQWLDD